MPIDLTNLPIVITGASSGIGEATAVACAKAGMPVVLGARREDRLAAVAGEIRASGGRALAVRCDVRSEGDCAELIERAEREFGAVYAVYANAGYGVEGAALDLTEQAWRDIFETNFWGTLHTIRPAVASMRRSGRGHVLICSSIVSKLGIPYFSAYSTTKAAQDHLGRALRHELAGVAHVSTIHPIGTDTEFSSTVSKHAGGAPRRARAPESWRQPPVRVAEAVVACLRRPKGEVWTSLPARLLAGVGTAFPGIADMVLSRKFPPSTPGPK